MNEIIGHPLQTFFGDFLRFFEIFWDFLGIFKITKHNFTGSLGRFWNPEPPREIFGIFGVFSPGARYQI